MWTWIGSWLFFVSKGTFATPRASNLGSLQVNRQACSGRRHDTARRAWRIACPQNGWVGRRLFDPHLDGSYNRIGLVDFPDQATLDEQVEEKFAGRFVVSSRM